MKKPPKPNPNGQAVAAGEDGIERVVFVWALVSRLVHLLSCGCGISGTHRQQIGINPSGFRDEDLYAKTVITDDEDHFVTSDMLLQDFKGGCEVGITEMGAIEAIGQNGETNLVIQCIQPVTWFDHGEVAV